MPSLQAFPSINIKVVSVGDPDKWETTINENGTVTTMTLKPGQTDTVTVDLKDTNDDPAPIPCNEGSTVTISVSAVVVRAK